VNDNPSLRDYVAAWLVTEPCAFPFCINRVPRALRSEMRGLCPPHDRWAEVAADLAADELQDWLAFQDSDTSTGETT
jgi:hypothetical protein